MRYKVKIWWDKLTDKDKDIVLEMVYDMTLDDMRFQLIKKAILLDK
jgi:hypothetical protein